MRFFDALELGYELHFHVHVEWFNGWSSYVVWFAVPKHHQEPKWGTLLLILTQGRQPGAVKSRLVQCSLISGWHYDFWTLPSAHQILLEPPTPIAVHSIPIIPVPPKGSVAAWSIQIYHGEKKPFYCWFSPWYIWIDSNDYNLYFHHDISIQSVIDSIRIYLLLMPVYPKIYLTGIPQARKCSSGRLSMEWHDESLSQIPSRRRGVTSGQGVNLP